VGRLSALFYEYQQGTLPPDLQKPVTLLVKFTANAIFTQTLRDILYRYADPHYALDNIPIDDFIAGVAEYVRRTIATQGAAKEERTETSQSADFVSMPVLKELRSDFIQSLAAMAYGNLLIGGQSHLLTELNIDEEMREKLQNLLKSRNGT
jgi:hypothetical protein